MKRGKRTSVVFFNASVVLAGLRSPNGGSGKVLLWSKKKKINGVISEIVFDEVLRNADKIGLEREEVRGRVSSIFDKILPAPTLSEVNLFKKIVVDFGDAHILASCKNSKAHVLVTLDEKHLLAIKKKVKFVNIVSPGELIKRLGERK